MADDINPFDVDLKEAAEAEEKERERLKLVQYLEDLRTVMSTRGGRNVLRVLLDRSGILHGGFVADPHEMNFKAGERNIGLKTLADMQEVDLNAYVKMLTEEQK